MSFTKIPGGYIAELGTSLGTLAFLGLKFRANTKLQGRDIASESRAVHGHPMPSVIELHNHWRVAAAGENATRCGVFGKFEIFEEMSASCEPNAVRPVESVCRSAICISNGGGIRQRFKLTGAFLASVAVADRACNRSTQGFQLDASARTLRDHGGLLHF